MDCMAHSMLTLRETCNIAYKRIDILRHVGPEPYTQVTRAGFAMRSCNIRKLAPAGLDRLKISLRWIEDVRTQLDEGIASTAEQSDIEESLKMTPVQIYGTLIRSYLLCKVLPMVWQATATEPPTLGEVAPIARKSAALPRTSGGENNSEGFCLRRLSSTVSLPCSYSMQLSLPSSSTLEQLCYIGLKCINVVFL